MKNIKILTLALILFLSKKSFCQQFEVPSNYKFIAAADYTPYEKDIIAAANWLIATPFNKETDKHKRVAAFVIQWINGSPTVNVEINTTILDFEKKNKGMLVLYMACCAKYVLENNYSKDMRAKHKAALRNMIEVYKRSTGIQKDKKMDKLIKSDSDGKLDEWLDENLKIN